MSFLEQLLWIGIGFLAAQVVVRAIDLACR